MLACAVCCGVLAGVSVASAQALVPNDTEYANQYALPLIHAPEAWDLTTGSNQVKVAMVDDGVNPAHTDLAPNLDMALGKDFGEGDDDASEVDSGHGSQTASILGSVGNNGAGIAGLAWSVDLIPVKVRSLEPTGDPSRGAHISATAEAAAFAYAGQVGARVANASFSNGGAARTPVQQTAIRAAIQSSPNTLFVVSAGNNSPAGVDNDASPRYPCNYPEPNLICVGGTDESDGAWANSNYGATSVDLAAPSENVESTKFEAGHANEYVRDENDGTSYGAPMVSGTAALYFARFPNATVADARNAILSGVDVKASLAGKNVTGGRLNVRNALEIRPVGSAPPAPSVSPAGGVYGASQQVTMSDPEPGTTIRYTVGNGTTVPPDPTAASTAYSGPITVAQDQVVKAAAFDPRGVRSPITQRNYTIDTVAPPPPSVSPASGTYTSAQQLTMSDSEAGATIRYTVGSGTTVPPDPVASSTAYSGPIPVSSSRIVKAAAFDAAGNRSTITRRNYTISTPKDTTPPPAVEISLPSGTYGKAQKVTFTSPEAGTTIRYTVGTGTTVPPDPTAGLGSIYTGPLSVASTQVIKVAAFDAAGNRSPVKRRDYRISLLIAPARQALSDVLRRGLRFTVTTASRRTVAISMKLSGTQAKRLRIHRTVGHTKKRVRGTRTLRLKLLRSARRALRRKRLVTVRVSVRLLGGATASSSASRRVVLRR